MLSATSWGEVLWPRQGRLIMVAGSSAGRAAARNTALAVDLEPGLAATPGAGLAADLGVVLAAVGLATVVLATVVLAAVVLAAAAGAVPGAGPAVVSRCWARRGAGFPACAGPATMAGVRARASAPSSAALAVNRYRMRPPSLAEPCPALPVSMPRRARRLGAPLGYGGPA